MIDVYDNVLEEHNAILIDDEVRKIHWKYDYHSHKGKINKHWHVFCGHNEEECKKNVYPWAHTLFEAILGKYDFHKKYSVNGYERIYCNAHTHGLEPHIHQDDGNFTMIYYPRMDWEIEWGGGTAIFNEIKSANGSPDFKKEIKNIEIDKFVHYKGNRLVIFDAYLPHQAQPVSRECYELRTCVVFKCVVDDGNRERLDFYKKNINEGNYKVEWR